jgi:hypothetical protein
MASSGDVELFLKYWQAPGREIGQFDLRSLPGDFRRTSRADLSSGVKLSSESDAYKPGEARGKEERKVREERERMKERESMREVRDTFSLLPLPTHPLLPAQACGSWESLSTGTSL